MEPLKNSENSHFFSFLISDYVVTIVKFQWYSQNGSKSISFFLTKYVLQGDNAS